MSLTYRVWKQMLLVTTETGTLNYVGQYEISGLVEGAVDLLRQTRK